MKKQLTDIFSSIGSLYTEQRELAAIWLTKSVNTGEGKTPRICSDTHVWLKDGELVDGEGEPTHKVLKCRGTLVNQFEMDLQCLADNSLITIKL